MKRKPYRFFLYLGLLFLQLIIFILPYRITLLLAKVLGTLAYYILPNYRKTAIENLRMAFGSEKSEDEIKRLAKAVFVNIAMTAAEGLSLRKLSADSARRLIDEDDYKKFRDILAKGKGIIALSSHFCNWEIAAVCAALYGFNITVIARRIYYSPYNRFLVSIRERFGVKTIYRDDKNILKACLARLKANSILCIVPDQDVDSVNGVFAEFFGRPAYTAIGPVVFAMLSGAPIVPGFTVRKNGGFRLIVEEPIYVETGQDKERIIQEYTQKWSRVVEKYIRMYPHYWVWFHKRWKTKQSIVDSQ